MGRALLEPREPRAPNTLSRRTWNDIAQGIHTRCGVPLSSDNDPAMAQRGQAPVVRAQTSSPAASVLIFSTRANAPMTTARQPSSLTSIFPSPAMARLVVFFAVHPGQRYHLRELMRLTGLPSASLQTELRRLAGMGALKREDGRGRAVFAADETHPAWRAWMLLLRSCARPADVLREALVDAKGIDGAFIFGSTVRGDPRPDSDLDVFLVGDEDGRQHASRLLSEASYLVVPELDVISYDRDELQARFRSGNAFVRRVVREPKEWLKGDAAVLEEVAA